MSDDYLILKTQQFCIVLFRVMGIFLIAPVFGQKQIPIRIKAAFAFFISLAMLPIVKIGFTSVKESWGMFTVELAREMAVGAIIGYASSLLFAGIGFGSELIGRQMGLGMARLYDPATGEQENPIIQLQEIAAVLIFLAINGHHWLISALGRSFEIAPVGDISMSSALPNKLIEMVGGIFSIGIRIAAPAFAMLLVVEIIMGVVARAVSGMNILIVGMPLKIGLGLIGLIITLPVFGYLFTKFLGMMQKDIIYLLHTI